MVYEINPEPITPLEAIYRSLKNSALVLKKHEDREIIAVQAGEEAVRRLKKSELEE